MSSRDVEICSINTKRGRTKFYKYKSVLLAISNAIQRLPKTFRYRRLDKLRRRTGTIGVALRYIYLKASLKECGDNVSISDNVYLLNPENISIGDNTSINPMSYIEGLGGIKIGSNVAIAHRVTIMSTSHIFADSTKNIKDQGLLLREVVIEDNVWIGANVVILAGVTIKSGAIIGASSLVNTDVESNCVYAGVPARMIKRR